MDIPPNMTQDTPKGLQMWIANVKGDGPILLAQRWEQLPKVPPGQTGRDTLIIESEKGADGELPPSAEVAFRQTLNVDFWAEEDTVRCMIGKGLVSFKIPAGDTEQDRALWQEFSQEINARNARLGINPKPSAPPVYARSTTYNIHTSQEMDALQAAAASGSHRLGWETEMNKRVFRSHAVKSYHVEIPADNAIPIERVESLTDALDADSAFALQYVISLCAPAPGQPPTTGAPAANVCIDDICKKVNPNYSVLPAAKRQEVKSLVWFTLQFGERARVIGRRTTTYKNDQDRDISTRIEVPLWSFGAIERPVQPSIFQETEIPTHVEILMSRNWLPFLSDKNLSQFIPNAEIIGAIPGSKPSGAIARVVGLQLARLFRMNKNKPCGAVASVTRRELLTKYPPKGYAFVDELKGNTPFRAVRYWHDGIRELVDRKIIAPCGEAAYQEMKGRGWQEDWLNTDITFRPGEAMQEALQSIDTPPAPALPKARKKKPGNH